MNLIKGLQSIPFFVKSYRTNIRCFLAVCVMLFTILLLSGCGNESSYKVVNNLNDIKDGKQVVLIITNIFHKDDYIEKEMSQVSDDIKKRITVFPLDVSDYDDKTVTELREKYGLDTFPILLFMYDGEILNKVDEGLSINVKNTEELIKAYFEEK